MSKNKMKFKKGDHVRVIAGSDKGKAGLIQKVMPDTRKVVIQGINLQHKRLKPSAENPTASTIKIEKPIHSSNISHIDPRTNLNTRIGYKITADGTKLRVSKKTDEQI